MRTIGLIVNPVAGMGGSVGLKGTDGDMYAKALEMGAEPVSPARTREFLSHLPCRDEIRLLVAPGPMGADHADAAGLSFEVIGTLAGQPGPEDTKTIARAMFCLPSTPETLHLLLRHRKTKVLHPVAIKQPQYRPLQQPLTIYLL